MKYLKKQMKNKKDKPKKRNYIQMLETYTEEEQKKERQEELNTIQKKNILQKNKKKIN